MNTIKIMFLGRIRRSRILHAVDAIYTFIAISHIEMGMALTLEKTNKHEFPLSWFFVSILIKKNMYSVLEKMLFRYMSMSFYQFYHYHKLLNPLHSVHCLVEIGSEIFRTRL